MKEQAKMKAKKHAKHPVQYGVDIAKEFNDVKSSIQVLADKINKQTTEFEKQLTKLNVNMEKVLNQLADHEMRLTILEQKQVREDEHSKVVDKIKMFAEKAIYGAFWIVVVVGAANGIKPLLKIFNLFAS